jgi:hypothetical protein
MRRLGAADVQIVLERIDVFGNKRRSRIGVDTPSRRIALLLGRLRYAAESEAAAQTQASDPER